MIGTIIARKNLSDHVRVWASFKETKEIREFLLNPTNRAFGLGDTVQTEGRDLIIYRGDTEIVFGLD